MERWINMVVIKVVLVLFLIYPIFCAVLGALGYLLHIGDDSDGG